MSELRSTAGVSEGGVILLKGNTEHCIYEDWQPYPFSQDPTFLWMSGIDQPEVFLTVRILDGFTSVYIPPHDPIKAQWERVIELEEYRSLFEVDDT